MLLVLGMNFPVQKTKIIEVIIQLTIPLDGTHIVAVRRLIHREVPTRVRQRGELN